MAHLWVQPPPEPSGELARFSTQAGPLPSCGSLHSSRLSLGPSPRPSWVPHGPCAPGFCCSHDFILGLFLFRHSRWSMPSCDIRVPHQTGKNRKGTQPLDSWVAEHFYVPDMASILRGRSPCRQPPQKTDMW